MRPALVVGGILAAVCSIWTAHALFAQTSGDDAAEKGGSDWVLRRVTVDKVEVRSAPSDKFHATGVLRKGDTVLVKGESSRAKGWLIIKPPPGSFSWIDVKYVGPSDPKEKGRFTAFVATDKGGDKVGIYPGSSAVNQEPQHQHARLDRGAALVILDHRPMKMKSGEELVPIDVMPDEIRYIPAEAVEGSASEPAPYAALAGPSQYAVTLAQADQAYAGRNWALARNLYMDVFTHSYDHLQKLHAGKRLEEIMRPAGGVAGAQAQPGHPQYLTGGGGQAPVHFATNTRELPGTTRTQTVRSGYRGTQWTEWGVLRRTGYTYNGQPMYRLDGYNGRVLYYATTDPQLTLEDYVNRSVCLYGTVSVQRIGTANSQHVEVSHVALP